MISKPNIFLTCDSRSKTRKTPLQENELHLFSHMGKLDVSDDSNSRTSLELVASLATYSGSKVRMM